LMRLIPEVEEHAEGLREIHERIANAPPEDTGSAWTGSSGS
jgi:hypothetical protein